MTQLTAHGEALEIPRHVFPQIAQAMQLVGQGHGQLGMAAQHAHHLTKVREGPGLAAGEGIGKVAEEPGPAEAAASDDHPVDPGLADHLQRVGGLPDVAVAQHRDGDVRFQGADRVPVRLAGVRLLCGSAVKCDGRAAGLLGDSAGIEKGLVITVDTDPGLDGYRYAVPRPPGRWPSRSSGAGRLYGSAAPHPLRVTLGTGHKVQVDMIDAVLLHKISVARAMIAGSTPYS